MGGVYALGMSNFGDDEPEDAWDAGDTRQEHVHNLILRLRLLDRVRDLDEDDPDILDQIETRVRAHQQQDDGNRDQVRIRQLLEDIAMTRAQ